MAITARLAGAMSGSVGYRLRIHCDSGFGYQLFGKFAAPSAVTGKTELSAYICHGYFAIAAVFTNLMVCYLAANAYVHDLFSA